MHFVVKRQFIQLAKHKGIKTINLVRRAECVNELKSLGADEVINIECEGSTAIFMFLLAFKIVNLRDKFYIQYHILRRYYLKS